jgi:hypothetical protein
MDGDFDALTEEGAFQSANAEKREWNDDSGRRRKERRRKERRRQNSRITDDAEVWVHGRIIDWRQ